MDSLTALLKVPLGMIGVAVCFWLYLKVLAFVHERGFRIGRLDASHEPPKIEIQSLFHGNTKDQDQI